MLLPDAREARRIEMDTTLEQLVNETLRAEIGGS